MLSSLRGPDGGPALRVRLLAGLVALALLLGVAPLLIPIISWLVDALR